MYIVFIENSLVHGTFVIMLGMSQKRVPFNPTTPTIIYKISIQPLRLG